MILYIAVACAIISTALQAARTIMHHRDRVERRDHRGEVRLKDAGNHLKVM